MIWVDWHLGQFIDLTEIFQGSDLKCTITMHYYPVLFGAPLGGTFFALEILHHQNVVEYFEAILPAVVASCASYTIFVAITQLGIGPTWHFPQYNVDSLYDFGAAIAYGIVGAIVGWLFIAVFRSVGRLFDSIRSE